MTFSGSGTGIKNADDVLFDDVEDGHELEYDGATEKWRNTSKAASVFINVKDYGAVGDGSTDDTAAIQAALIAGAGRTVVIPESTAAYIVTEPLAVLSGTSVVMNHSATVEQTTFYKPVFDVLDADDVSIRGGKLTYNGDRTYNGNLGSQRGGGIHEYSAGVWTNGSRTRISTVVISGFQSAVMVSGWNGTAVESFHNKDTVIDDVLVDECGFGLLATGTDRLVVKNLRGKYTLPPADTSPLPPPAHLIYFSFSGGTFHRNPSLSNLQAYDGTDSYAYQFKAVRGGSAIGLVADNCPGVLTLKDCQDMVISGVVSTNDVNVADVGALYMQDSISSGCHISDVTIKPANVTSRSARLDGSGNTFTNLRIEMTRNSVVTSNDMSVQGIGNAVIRPVIRNNGSGGGRSIAFFGTDCAIIDPVVYGASIAIDMHAAGVRPVLEYRPGSLQVQGGSTPTNPKLRFNGVPTDPVINRWSQSVVYTVADNTGLRVIAGDVTHAQVGVTTDANFIVGNPYFPGREMELTYTMTNKSGGNMGILSWGAAFILSDAWVNPSAGDSRSITFKYDGTYWNQLS